MHLNGCCVATQVLLQLGDWSACVPLVRRMLNRDAQHPRALSLLALLTAKLAQPGKQATRVSPFQAKFLQAQLTAD